MRREILFSFTALSLFAVTSLLGGCGAATKEGAESALATVQNAPRVGSESCINTCHAATQDLTMLGANDGRTIKAAWKDSVHQSGAAGAECEDCHGGGGLHFGLGPLAYPVPDYTRCQQCHNPTGTSAFDDPAEFNATKHANANQIPDKFFFQGGTGADQGTKNGVPEFVFDASGNATSLIVTKNQHIEECSVCHNSNQKFRYAITGELVKPDPGNMPNPAVSCASCHDGHQVGRMDDAFLYSSGAKYPLFRKVQVDANGSNDALAGNWIRPQILPTPSTNESIKLSGAVGGGTVVKNTAGLTLFTALPGTANPFDTSTEKLCASCHTKGKYKYNRQATHNNNTYPQYLSSGHADKGAVPWFDFTNFSSSTGAGQAGHRSTANYPYNMNLTNAKGPANTAPSACFKCHNGLVTPTFMGPFDTAKRRPTDGGVVWGNATATCVTCHDPHSAAKNVRIPEIMTNYSGAGGAFLGATTFLDRATKVPAGVPSVVCIFCHQGRESGFTEWNNNFSPNRINVGTNFAFNNPHYLGGAAMLYGANGYEFSTNAAGQPTSTAATGYANNAAHLSKNCAGCHMENASSDNTAGGHTWRPNVVTCTECHSTITDFDTFRMPTDASNYDGTGATTPIPVVVLNLSKLLSRQLRASNIIYNANGAGGQYFFKVSAPTTAFAFTKAFTSDPVTTPAPNTLAPNTTIANLLKASFNLQFIAKGLPSGGPDPIGDVNVLWDPANPATQTGIPNVPAATHNFRYAIQLLQDSIVAAGGTLPAGAVRPAGTKPATVYTDLKGNSGTFVQ